MSERHDLAVLLIVQRVLLNVLKDQHDQLREYARATEFDLPGVRQPAQLGEVTIGAVSVSRGRRQWRVTNLEKWVAWVEEHRPGEVVDVPTVRSSFTEAVLRDGGLVDPQSGEVTTPPGIEYVEADPTLVEKPTDEARQAVLDALGVDAAVVLGLVERTELEP